MLKRIVTGIFRRHLVSFSFFLRRCLEDPNQKLMNLRGKVFKHSYVLQLQGLECDAQVFPIGKCWRRAQGAARLILRPNDFLIIRQIKLLVREIQNEVKILRKWIVFTHESRSKWWRCTQSTYRTGVSDSVIPLLKTFTSFSVMLLLDPFQKSISVFYFRSGITKHFP